MLLLPQRIAAQVAARPEAVALLHLGGTSAAASDGGAEPPEAQPLRYGELHRRACRVAAALPSAAAGPVALLLDEAPGSVVAELGALYAGAAFVPLDPNTPAARLRYQLVDSGAAAVIHSRAQAPMVRALLGGADGALRLDTVRAVELEAATEAAGDFLADAAAWPAALQPSDASHIIYTSGSTGEPKGVVCEHGALAHYADAKLRVHAIDRESRVLLVSAATWDPSVGDAFSTLACGGALVTAPRARLVQELHDVLSEGGVTHVCSTPALWGLLPAVAGWSSLPALRVVALGGEQLPAALVRQWLPPDSQQQLRLLNTYGVTEATVYQTVGECRAEQPRSWVGRPLPGVTLAVAAAPGETGEVWLGGTLVARGYLGAPELTADKFITLGPDSAVDEGSEDALRWLSPGRWFRTGDLGKWHRASESVLCVPASETAAERAEQDVSGPVLELMGRMDSQVKLRGFRIELGEVESVLVGHALLGLAVVVLYSGEPRDAKEPDVMIDDVEPEPEPEPEPRLVAYVTLSDGVASSGWDTGGAEVTVRVHCRRQLPVHAVPTQFVHLDAIPLTASGKVDRKALPSPPPLRSINQGQGSETKRPMTPMEAAVAEAWADVLGLAESDVRLEDNFFHLGGSSVTAVAMVKRLQAVQSAGSGDWSHHDPRVRYCALFRKPRLLDYAAFLEWVAVAAPTRSAGDQQTFEGRMGETDSVLKAAAGGLDAEELLGMMEVALPGADDERALLNTALQLAARGGHVKVVEALLAAGACPDGGFTKKDRGEAPLLLAASAGHIEICKALVATGATPNLPDGSARTAAHVAASGGHVDLLRWLLCDMLVPIDGSQGGGTAWARLQMKEVKDVNKWSPQHFAAWHGRTEVLDLALRLKAAQSLALAHERRQRETGSFSELSLQADLDGLRDDENALLQRAPHLLEGAGLEMMGQHSVTVAVLEAAQLEGRLPFPLLRKAVKAAEAELGPLTEWTAGRSQAKAVRDFDFILNASDRWSRTPLSWAIFKNHSEAAQLLIDAGASLDWKNPYPLAKQKRNNNVWNTSLHLAVQAAEAAGTAAVVGADGALAEEDNAGQHSVSTPEDRFASLRVLLRHSQVLDLRNVTGNYGAVEDGGLIDSVDNSGRTALHEAACLVFKDELHALGCEDHGMVAASLERASGGLRLLLGAGAALDVLDNAGRTPLHDAVRAGQTASVAMLIAAGADTTALDSAGRRPADCAVADAPAPLRKPSPTVIGRRARAADNEEKNADKKERLATELVPKLRKVLEAHAVHEPLVASVLSARYEKMWEGEQLQASKWGYKKLSTLLRAMPEICEVTQVAAQNSASAPFLMVKLKSGGGESAAKGGEPAAQVEAWKELVEEWSGQGALRKRAAELTRVH